MRLYVGNLPWTVTEQQIRDFFAPVPLAKVDLITDHETGRLKGFGFVEIKDAAAARQAISDLHRTDLGGRMAAVSEAIDKQRQQAPATREHDSGGKKRKGRDSDRGRRRDE